MQERIRIGTRRKPLTCPYCTSALEGVLAYCGGCGARYHSGCWNELGGCAVLGCRMRAASPRQRDPEQLPPQPPTAPRLDAPRQRPSACYGVSARTPRRSAGERVLRGLLWAAVGVHTLASMVWLAWWVGPLAAPPGAEYWLVPVLVSYMALLIHCDDRFDIRSKHDPRGMLSMLLLLVPFSGAIYWLRWGRQEE